MKAIKKDYINILKRRRDFLRRRIEERGGKVKDGDYDALEQAALTVALEYLLFIQEHSEVRNKIKAISIEEELVDY